MKKYISEVIGTFTLVFLGCGTAASIGCNVAGGYLATALAFGLSIVAMAYSIGHISGCHVNPAVSLAMYLRKELHGEEFVKYVVSQITGAFLGALTVMAIIGKDSGLGSNTLYNESVPLSLLIETILTFIFIFVILCVKDEKHAGFSIGLTLTLVHILGIGLTGTSVNPARSLAPAILSGHFKGLWVFIVAPLIGAALATYLHKYLFTTEKH